MFDHSDFLTHLCNVLPFERYLSSLSTSLNLEIYMHAYQGFTVNKTIRRVREERQRYTG